MQQTYDGHGLQQADDDGLQQADDGYGETPAQLTAVSKSNLEIILFSIEQKSI